jgi:hypothetical protein
MIVWLSLRIPMLLDVVITAGPPDPPLEPIAKKRDG